MKIRIYQPDLVNDANGGLLHLVYEGDVSASTVEDLSIIFGESTKDPRRGTFRGHPLKTGDIVEIWEENSVSIYKFTEGDWTDGSLVLVQVNQDVDMRLPIAWNPNAVTGVLIEPGNKAYIARIDLNDKVNMERLFGYHYQVVKLPTGFSMICRDIAFNYDTDPLPYDTLNRMLKYSDTPFAALRHPAFFCKVYSGANGEIVSSLTENECSMLLRQYELPENFYILNGKLMSLPYYPELHKNAVGKEVTNK